MKLNNVVVALDLSDSCAELVEQAKKVSDPKHTKIWLIHVAPPNPDFVGLEVGPQYIRDNVAEELKEDHREIQEFAEALRIAGFKAEGLMIQGQEAPVLLGELDRLDARNEWRRILPKSKGNSTRSHSNSSHRIC